MKIQHDIKTSKLISRFMLYSQNYEACRSLYFAWTSIGHISLTFNIMYEFWPTCQPEIVLQLFIFSDHVP